MYSTFAPSPPPLRLFMGWVSVDLNLTWEFFSGYSGLPPISKSDPSQKHLALVLRSGIMHDRLAAAWGAFHMHLADPVWAAPFVIQPSGLQVMMISGHIIAIIIFVICMAFNQSRSKRNSSIEGFSKLIKKNWFLWIIIDCFVFLFVFFVVLLLQIPLRC